VTSPKNRWPFVRLGDVAEFRNGVNYSKTNFGTGVKVIGVSDFQDNVKASFDDLEEINPAGVVREGHYLKDGDILFVRSNGNRDLIGRSMFVENPPEEVTHSAFSIRLRFVRKDCLPRFYAYLLRSSLFRQSLSLHGGGTNISNLNQDILGRLHVPLPPTPVQHQIASILAAYDDLIEINARRVKILEEIAQMIYREWFVNLRFPGRENAEMTKSRLGPIPSGWKVGTVSDLVRISRNGVAPKDFGEETFLHFSIPAFDLGCMPLPEKGEKIRSNKYIVVPGCVLLSKLNPRISRIWIPAVQGTNRAIASTEFLVLIPVIADSRNYAYHLLRSDEFQGQFIGMSLGTSTSHQRVKPNDFAQMPICLPPPPLLRRFANVVEPMMRQTVALRRNTADLREIRNLVSPKLISGEVSVEELEPETANQT
jgi:type I restriction enzyme, S subunit